MWNDLVSLKHRTAKILRNLWVGWRERRAAMAELAGCPQDEVNRMASELGLSAGDLHDLVAQGPSAADLLTKRLRAARHRLGGSCAAGDKKGFATLLLVLRQQARMRARP